MTGEWLLDSYPKKVIIHGIPFVKARWAKPEKGVLVQYREDTPKESKHLKVYDDGTWRIDHIDTHNPDTGSAIGHFFQDYNPLIGPLLFAGVLLVGSIAIAKRKFKPRRRSNPAGFTAKEERKYKAIKKGYGRDPRAAEIAARTVYAQRKKK